MPARLIAYPPEAAAITRWVAAGGRLRIGRAADCDLALEHSSVSRNHAELQHDGEHWQLRDLGSKNGSYADGIAVEQAPLRGPAWLRFGDVHCDFAEFTDQQSAGLRARQQQRRDFSLALTRRVEAQADHERLPDEVLRGVVELADCSRGFLLLAADGDDYAVRASVHLDPNQLGARVFGGSVGAVRRALSTRAPVVVNEVARSDWATERASIVDSGLKSLICLPLLDGPRTLGAIYADRRTAGEPITQFDLELLSAFAESAALWLLARRAVAELDDAPRWSTLVGGPAHTLP
ncbi:FHA domain-containing protein [Lysobacter silvisoli]|uniref:FHA domain-containing protein n=1 Tax=Lysobacter silvisoli TaxID=2293254 RepID=A0A371K5A7_9GAMM|nr:FHA domain-containing protein [Lysobacter silvisoli]RDZ29116.1 FHA domain-containing protein [Lysobacter silvisoli]